LTPKPRRVSARRDAEGRRVNALMTQIENNLAREFVQAVLRAQTKLVGGGELDAARVIETEAEKFANALERAYVAAGQAEVAEMGRRLGLTHLRFNPKHVETARLIANARSKFLLNFSRSQRSAIQQALSRANKGTLSAAVIQKARPRGAAKNALGLTPHQEQIVENYRGILAANSAEAINGRKLRDRRFDNTVQNAIDSNEPLTWTQINRMTQRYRERWVGFRARTIARTQSLMAVNAGRNAALKQVAEQAHFDSDTIIRTWNAEMDDRTRDSHYALDGEEVEGMDEPFQADAGPIMYPGDPAAPPEEIINCFVPGTEVSGQFLAGLKTWYSGPVRELRTKGGNRLTVTINHPVLTPEGLIPAKQLTEGQALLSYQRQAKSLLMAGVDYQKSPITIEQVFELLRTDGSRRVVVGAANLYGDAQFGDGYVDIVGAEGILILRIESGANLPLILTHPQLRFSKAFGALNLDLLAISRAAPSTPGFACLALHKGTRGFHLAPLKPLSVGAAAPWNVSLIKQTVDRPPSAALLFSQFVRASAGQIALDNIVGVREYEFVGHVYDLQSPYGWILANNILTGNCRCWLEHSLPGEKGEENDDEG
jgi:Phage Mu protein F like protein